MIKVFIDEISGSVKFGDRAEGKKLMLEIKNGNISELYVKFPVDLERILSIF
jgi:DUF4097 and DUF4098 domain-containing protein YvlB